MATGRKVVRTAFYDRIEADDTFFQYFGDFSDEEIQAIADTRANTYIAEAVAILKRRCEVEIDFSIDEENDTFIDDLTAEEILLIGGDLAFEVYIGREIAKMKTRINTFSSSDLRALHSPASERKSFMDMYRELKADNEVKILDYASRDRTTGRYISVNKGGGIV